MGSVLETRDASGTVNGFYVLLPDGVQKITGFVADLLRTGNSHRLRRRRRWSHRTS